MKDQGKTKDQFKNELAEMRQRNADLQSRLQLLEAAETARGQAEEQIRKSEDILSASEDIAQMGSWEWDIVHDEITWSDGTYRLFGWKPHEVQVNYNVYLNRVHPEDRDQVDQWVQDTLKSDMPYENEHRIVRLDGEVRVHHTRGRLYRDAQGKPTRLIGSVLDVTERVRTETQRDATLEALRESEERFRSVYSQAPIAIELYDPEGRLMDANAACLDLFGIADVEAVKGFNLFEDPNVPGDAKQRLLAGQAVEYESEFDFELVKEMDLYETTKSGRSYVNCLITPWVTAAHGQSGFLVHVRDITERVRAESHRDAMQSQRDATLEALRESEAKHRSLTDDVLDSSVIGIFILDSDLRVVWINQALERCFGVRREKIIGKDKRQLIRERIKHIFEDPESFADKVFATYDDNTYTENFECHVLPDGERQDRWLEHWSQPIHSGLYAGGRIELYADITERKRAEEQLRASLEEKEVLLRELYHRTKNNMQVISSILGLQAAYTHDEQVLSIFRETENRIQSMALVHQKLYQSQRLSSIDLKEYVADLVALLTQSYEAPPDKIALVLDTESVSVLIDTAIPCGLILNELLSNAFKHAFPADRSGEIKIRLRRAGDGTLWLEVSDDGVGVPDGSDLRKSDTLGMQTVFGIAERQLQGQVTVETEGGVAWRMRFRDDLYAARV